MLKVKLNLDELRVEGFDTHAGPVSTEEKALGREWATWNCSDLLSCHRLCRQRAG